MRDWLTELSDRSNLISVLDPFHPSVLPFPFDIYYAGVVLSLCNMVSLRRRCTPRTALVALLLLLLFAILFHLKTELWNPINGHDYFVEEDLQINDPANERQVPTAHAPAKRRTAVVVASQRTENATWLSTYFPDWEKNIYAVDDPTAELTVPKNKGRESMVYLTYADWTDCLLATRGDRANA
jgi:hypothetical protein